MIKYLILGLIAFSGCQSKPTFKSDKFYCMTVFGGAELETGPETTITDTYIIKDDANARVSFNKSSCVRIQEK